MTLTSIFSRFSLFVTLGVGTTKQHSFSLTYDAKVKLVSVEKIVMNSLSPGCFLYFHRHFSNLVMLLVRPGLDLRIVVYSDDTGMAGI